MLFELEWKIRLEVVYKIIAIINYLCCHNFVDYATGRACPIIRL